MQVICLETTSCCVDDASLTKPMLSFQYFEPALFHFQIWNLKPGWGSRPDIYVEKAHSDDITGLKFSSDGNVLLSRSFDGSLKVMFACLLQYLVIRSNAIAIALPHSSRSIGDTRFGIYVR